MLQIQKELEELETRQLVEIEKQRKANEIDMLEKRKKEEMKRHTFLMSRKAHDKDMKFRLVTIPEYIPV